MIYEGIITLIIPNNDILPISGLNLGYTSNIALRLLVLSQATPSGTPSGGGLYFTVYPLFCPHMDTVFNRPGVAGAVL